MVQLSHPSSALPIIAIRENIRAQLKVSRDMFALVQRIADVARSTDDDGVRKSLEPIMSELLENGKYLSDHATATGRQILEFVNSLAAEELT